MRQDEAEALICAKFRRWWDDQTRSERSPRHDDAFRFFVFLDSNKSCLLEFRSTDKWHRVRRWLEGAGLIQDS